MQKKKKREQDRQAITSQDSTEHGQKVSVPTEEGTAGKSEPLTVQQLDLLVRIYTKILRWDNEDSTDQDRTPGERAPN